MLNIGAMQVWTPETFPYTTETVGGQFILEGKIYLVTQSEITRINSLPDAETVVAQAQQIYEMIRDGKIEMKDGK